jgi:hypothetical protein
MTEMDLPTLATRLDRLERDNRRLRRWVCALGTGLAALLTMGQLPPGPKVVEAESFVVRGAKGEPRALLGGIAGGAVTLALRDERGAERLTLVAAADGESTVRLTGPDGANIEAAARADGSRIGLEGRARKASIALGVNGADLPAITLQDHSERTRAWLRVLEVGEVTLALSDRDGRPRTGFVVSEKGEPALALTEANGEFRASLGVRSDGVAVVSLAERGGESRAEMSVAADGTADLVLADRTGRPTFTAPPRR